MHQQPFTEPLLPQWLGCLPQCQFYFIFWKLLQLQHSKKTAFLTVIGHENSRGTSRVFQNGRILSLLTPVSHATLSSRKIVSAQLKTMGPQYPCGYPLTHYTPDTASKIVNPTIQQHSMDCYFSGTSQNAWTDLEELNRSPCWLLLTKHCLTVGTCLPVIC